MVNLFQYKTQTFIVKMKTFKPETKLREKIFTVKETETYHLDYIENKSILGIDIYKYSDYPENAQVYVPILFNSIYRLTVESCIRSENFFFSDYGMSITEFKSKFISTGDGGFQIFDNPLQATIFASYFELNVRRFNSGSYTSILNKNLFKIIDRIELRYSITYDKIYCYDDNFFGTGIINNARILAKDNLNRMLIDDNTLRWFNRHLNTIENLMTLTKIDFLNLSLFKEYKIENKTLIFNDYNKGVLGVIKSVDVLKIGSIKSKNTTLDIYNLKIQLHITFENSKTFEKECKTFLYTIGNLNTQGIQ
jgi:hypothetical protein